MMNRNKRIIVNFASGNPAYLMGSQRLLNSQVAVENYSDFMVCSPDMTNEGVFPNLVPDCTVYLNKRYPTTIEFGDSPSHQTHPYAFKAFIIQEARDMGYERVMWGDSSLILLKNPEKYWKLSNEVGVVLFDNTGCLESIFTSDDCLEHMGCDPEFANTFYQVEAFAQIWDFTTKKANKLFEEYLRHSMDDICPRGISGSSRPEFKAHRHDQSILSYFAEKQNINRLNYGAWSWQPHEIGTDFFPTFAKIGNPSPWNWEETVASFAEKEEEI